MAKSRSRAKKGNRLSAKKQSNKKPAYTEPEYELRAIINESDDYYEVDWKPTWLLKAWVNQTAIDAWNNRQLELISVPYSDSSKLSPPPDDIRTPSLLSNLDDAFIANDDILVDRGITRSPIPAREFPIFQAAQRDQILDDIVSQSQSQSDKTQQSQISQAQQASWPQTSTNDASLASIQDSPEQKVLFISPHRLQPYDNANAIEGTSSQSLSETGRQTFQPRAQARVVSSEDESQSSLRQQAQRALSQLSPAPTQPSFSQHIPDTQVSVSIETPEAHRFDQQPQSAQELLKPDPLTFFESLPISAQGVIPNSSYIGSSSRDISQISRRSGLQHNTPQRLVRLATPRTTSPAMSSLPHHIMEEIIISRPSSPAPSSGRRSPSAIPAIEPLQHITQEEQNTSERYSTLLPQSETLNLSQQLHRESFSEVGTDQNGVFTVGIAMLPSQADAYKNIPSEGVIDEILSMSDDKDLDLLRRGEDLLQRMRNHAIHLDLAFPEALTQYNDLPDYTPVEYGIACSSKFRFLHELLTHPAMKELHVVFPVDDGALWKLLKQFCTGLHVALTTSTSVTASSLELPSVTLLDDVLEESSTLHADVIIDIAGYDGILPQITTRAGFRTPIVRVMIPSTVEHAERSLPARQLSQLERTQFLLRAFRDYRQDFSQAQEALSLSETVQRVVDFVTGLDSSWNLPTLNNLYLESSSDVSLATAEQTNGKRAPEDDDDNEDRPSKRIRLEESNGVVTVAPEDISLTPLDDTLAGSQESYVARLRDIAMASQAREAGLEAALEQRQYDFEEQRVELNQTVVERDRAITTAQNAVRRLESNENQMTALRKDLRDIKEQLVEANVKLADHTVPERAELEQQQQLAQQAVAQAEKLNTRIENMRRDLEYAQSLYQQSSSQAQNLASENTSLIQRLEKLEADASGENKKVRKLNLDRHAQLLRQENDQMRAMIQTWEVTLKVRDDEIARLKDANRGRMGTRGTSVPRSPRMNSPLKHELPRGGSRHGSPAAGDMRDRTKLHPLRNG